MKDEDTDSDNNFPVGNVISHNQSGGITAYSVTVTGIPEPKISIERQVQNEPTAEGFMTRVVVRIDTQVVINNFFIRVKSPTLFRLFVSPLTTGSMFSNSFEHDGWFVTRIQQANGSYLATVVTRCPESLTLEYDFV